MVTDFQYVNLFFALLVTEVKEFHTFELLLHLMAPQTKQSILYKFEVIFNVILQAVIHALAN